MTSLLPSANLRHRTVRIANPSVKPDSWFQNAHDNVFNDVTLVVDSVEASIFTNAHDLTFNNFTIIINSIEDYVAPNAILNAGGRADETRCHPGTREEVIDHLDKWMKDAQNGVTASRILWLSGPAGAGKTAIVQTVAERWKSRGVHAANFFFFRTDPTRNHPNSLVSTLLHQIFDFYPAARQKFEEIITSAPGVLRVGLIERFRMLLCSSLRSVGPSLSQPIVLVIDGLDECIQGEDSQRQVLLALDMLVSQNDLPFLVLVASRVEYQITTVFKKLHSTVDSISLDNKYSPSEDIHLFVTAEFDRIKRTHPLAPQDEDWPLPSDIDGIVTKSSGQFIYAAIVMRFIAQSPADPKLSLAHVQGTAHNADTESPFSPLDSMYTRILGQARDQEALTDILHVALILSKTINNASNGMLYRILNTYNRRYTESVIEACISDVTAVVHLQRRQLIFHHASLVDYLWNPSRSGRHFVNLAAFSPKILPAIWEHIGKIQGVRFGAEFALDKVESMLLDFMNTIIELEPADFGTFSNAQEMKNVFKFVYPLCVKNGNVAIYKRMIRGWITYYISLTPSESQDKSLYGIPCSKRYITMAEIDRAHDIMEPTSAMGYVLRPQSPFDAREMSLWIKLLLHRIHRIYYPHRLGHYKRLIGKWIFLAVSNNITLKQLHNLPYTKECLRSFAMPKSTNIFFKIY